MKNESLPLKSENNEKSPDPILDSIMTAEEYGCIKHAVPYVFELKDGDRQLSYFGTSHVRDPQDPLFEKITKAFDEANPDIVFVEGINIRGNKKLFDEKVKTYSHEKIIEQMGESGFTLKLGLDKGVEWHCPEPADEDLYRELLAKGFSKDQIFAWDVFHVLPQYHRQMSKKGFKEYVQNFIDGFRQSTNWEGFDYSYDHALKEGEQILGKSVDVENDPDSPDYVNPIPFEVKKESQTILNRISQTAGIFRDKKIVTDISKALHENKKVFVVYGASHAVMQEPALRKLFVK